MKKAIKAALCILSALTISSVCAVSASAGTLTKEELFLKYLPDGADETVKFSPDAPVLYVDDEGDLQDYVGEANAELERLRMLNDAGLITDEEFTEIVEPMISRTLELTDNAVDQIVVFNAYRRGAYGRGQNTQWFIGADYENGFYYVLMEDGTASIVGADQNVFQEATVLEIPAEIGGVPVTKIEDRAS